MLAFFNLALTLKRLKKNTGRSSGPKLFLTKVLSSTTPVESGTRALE